MKEINDEPVGSNKIHNSIRNVVFNYHRSESYTVVYVLETWAFTCDLNHRLEAASSAITSWPGSVVA